MSAALTLREQLREDWETHSRNFLMPGLHALVVHRVAVWRHSQPAPVRTALGVLCHIVNTLLIRNVYGVEISDRTVIGRRLRIGHHMGVILGPGAVIGDDVLLRHNVTLGRSGDSAPGADPGASQVPRIGNGVQIGAGAQVLGGVVVGDRARIGPGAVVMTDVPADASAFAALARVMKPPAAPAGRPDGPASPATS